MLFVYVGQVSVLSDLGLYQLRDANRRQPVLKELVLDATIQRNLDGVLLVSLVDRPLNLAESKVVTLRHANIILERVAQSFDHGNAESQRLSVLVLDHIIPNIVQLFNLDSIDTFRH